jgi:hypothetical protein
VKGNTSCNPHSCNKREGWERHTYCLAYVLLIAETERLRKQIASVLVIADTERLQKQIATDEAEIRKNHEKISALLRILQY